MSRIPCACERHLPEGCGVGAALRLDVEGSSEVMQNIITPDFVLVLALTPDNKFLCFRQTKYAVDGTTLAPVGGIIEPEEDPLNAAKRELLEETGLTSVDLWLCGVISIDTGKNPGIGIFIFRGEWLNGELRESQEGTLAWISLNHVYSLPLVEDLHSLLPKVLETEKDAAPFSALYTYDECGKLHINFRI